MRHFSIFLLTVLATCSINAQHITGQWNGVLKIQGIQLRVVFNITETSDGLSATMDSPDQGANGIPVTTTTFDNSKITFEIPVATIQYTGELIENEIVGTFKQNGQEFPMNLSRKSIEKKKLLRPQEPIQPYPYYSEDLTFENKKAGIKLAGTLTLPNKDGFFPAVILISGSGPQNRNEELLGHKPFLVLADHLTRNGIAVLRYDDRGTAASEGDFTTATSFDFATDVEAAITYLKTRKEIHKKKIGLIGHSEGGIIAPMVASKSKDIAFIVLLAGTGIQGDQLLLLQQKLIGKGAGLSDADLQKNEAINRKVFDVAKQSENIMQLDSALRTYLKQALKDNAYTGKPSGMSDDDFVELQVKQIANPWMHYFIRYNPAPALEKVRCAVLALNGEKDVQVPAKENLDAIGKALAKGGNKKVTLKALPNQNHLFQECETGLLNEYGTIEQTFSPKTLQIISDWIIAHTK